jgi:CRISPR-associated endonuclease/helicase Cas3
MSASNDFDRHFELLTGNRPFPWQQSLYQHFIINKFPDTCTLPTGLGKTSIIPVWLIALAHASHIVPRRLAYVVNRRTVVDQATDEIKDIRDRLELPELKDLRAALSKLCSKPADSPLAISTLRGQFADNAEWTADPARPAVITGTVDMIGSRLLFSAYGAGFKRRPTHAALLGQDTLLIHDEAHLEPAFQQLLESIVAAQKSEQARSTTSRSLNLRVMALTATPRDQESGNGLTLTPEERGGKVPAVRERIEARKGIVFHPIADDKKPVETVVLLALAHKDSGQAILIYLRTVEQVQKVVDALRKKVSDKNVLPLTGTMRGLERDTLVEHATFKRFLPKPPADATPGTVYLVSTSAGEVGVNISAEHLVCDLTPFSSAAQRYGRVNRFGKGDARIDIVHPESFDDKKFDNAREKTLELLRALPLRTDERHDASPQALGKLIDDAGVAARDAAFTPPPEILPATNILFDAWSLTSVTMRPDPMPGRPPVADWLHGVPEDWEPPETYVAWREEVDVITGPLLEEHLPEDLLDDFPLKPRELLRDNSKRVLAQLELLSGKQPDCTIWIQKSDGTVVTRLLSDLVNRTRDPKELDGLILILPPTLGGLTSGGMLDGGAEYDPARNTARAPVEDPLAAPGRPVEDRSTRSPYDVADILPADNDKQASALRCRRWRRLDEVNSPEEVATMKDWRIVQRIQFAMESEADEQPAMVWTWYVRNDSAAGTDFARWNQELQPHLGDAERYATQIADSLQLNEPERTAVILAAKYHDLGKDRALWQQGIGNREYATGRILAKSDGRRTVFNHTYRHEFGSLLDAAEYLKSQPEEIRDLALHLIAAHHGRARPHFPSPPDRNEAFDPNYPATTTQQIAIEVPRRFARLQRKYGRWGLAWLETLVRSADVMASRVESPTGKDVSR